MNLTKHILKLGNYLWSVALTLQVATTQNNTYIYATMIIEKPSILAFQWCIIHVSSMSGCWDMIETIKLTLNSINIIKWIYVSCAHQDYWEKHDLKIFGVF